ncbi:MAG: S8 family serine peptidase [Betaproteobacteria bacterium]|nr:S8 family serine peptidase [Betaproteobacteria bacterium]
MRLRLLPVAIAGILAVPALPTVAATALATIPSLAGDPTIQAEKKVITSADQMPRRKYKIAKLPSELLEAPKADLKAAVDALDKDLALDLATLDIRDRATRTGLIGTRAQIAMFRGDYAAAQRFLRDVRAQQEKEADKLTSGIMLETLAATLAAGGTPEAQRERFRSEVAARWGALPWAVVGDNLKGAKGQMELLSKNVIVGSFRTSLDPAAKNLGLDVPAPIVAGIVSSRNAIELVTPVKDDAVAVLQGLVDRNQVAKADNWTPRLVTLPADAKAKPVVVGIWDSGTDVDLFRKAANPGIAFDKDAKPVTALVRPMGDAQKRLPMLKRFVKGSMDVRAAVDSEDARAFKKHVSSLKPDEVKQFTEDLAAVGMWVHGTHVAGIAVEGNPFAQVTAVAMHWSNDSAPQLPTPERAARNAAAYRVAVEHFKKAGARVVNMSWRYGPSFYEGALAYHNVGKTPEERKEIAKRIFAVEKQALLDAITDAPGILFVAGSGNEDNSADFSEYIPAGFQLPNLITAGAVDQAGTETAFSTFGKTVVIHANGFEVVSYMPGGEKTKLSGTSMASPQIANLAAKLFAVKPELTPVQAKALILQGADRNGRVNLANPKKTMQLAGYGG